MSEAKEFFQEIRNIDKQINVKLEHLERMKSLATKVTSVMREDSSKPSGVSRSVENNVEKIIQLQDEINADIDRFVYLKRIACNIIRQLPDEKQRRCMEERYLNGKTWEAIAVNIGIAYQSVCRIHGRALQEVDKFFHESDRM